MISLPTTTDSLSLPTAPSVVQLSVLPLPSSAVSVTVTGEPISLQSKVLMSSERPIEAESVQLSLSVLSTSVPVIVTLPPASSWTVMSLQVTTGSILSSTVTSAVQLSVLPLPSSAVSVTVTGEPISLQSKVLISSDRPIEAESVQLSLSVLNTSVVVIVALPAASSCTVISLQVMIGSISAFTMRCERGISANREKAEAWLAKNAIIVTALNPLIGYDDGVKLVKESSKRGLSIREIALEKAAAGELRHKADQRLINVEEIEGALLNLRDLTEGGIIG